MLGISISINPETGEVDVELVEGKSEYRKRNKGKSLLSFPAEYVVIDTETTGLDPDYCELIEAAAVRVVDDIEVERFQTLIKPNDPIPDFITELTGITNEMVNDAPTPDIAIPELINFIGDSIIVAHNAHFDINFLYDYSEQYIARPFSNDFICTMRISRRVFPEMSNHKLKTLCKNILGIVPPHRALGDALAAWEIFKACKAEIIATIGLDEFAKNSKNVLKAREIIAKTATFCENHPLYGKYCVFTGTLSKMVRRDAMQAVVDLGGYCLDNVTREADYLIMGIQDYSKFTDGEKSNKLKKTEKLIQKGYEIEILSENIFYDLLLSDEAS